MRKMKVIALDDIRFLKKDNSEIDNSNRYICCAFIVSVIFKEQNNRVKYNRTTQENTVDTVMNPIKMLATIFQK